MKKSKPDLYMVTAIAMDFEGVGRIGKIELRIGSQRQRVVATAVQTDRFDAVNAVKQCSEIEIQIGTRQMQRIVAIAGVEVFRNFPALERIVTIGAFVLGQFTTASKIAAAKDRVVRA